MTYCNYAALVGGLCGPSTYNSSITECVTLANCNKDVFSHLSLHKASDDVDVSSESKLILARAGIFNVDEIHKRMTICPRHRDLYGIRWRCNKMRCAIPDGIAAHKSSSVKGQCGLTSLLSSYIFNQTKMLLPVGTPLCKRCKTYLTEQIPDVEPSFDDESESDIADVQPSETEQEEDTSTSTNDELIEGMSKLQIAEETLSVFSPDTASTASSGDASDTSALPALNKYLEVCHIEPLLKPMLDWNEVSERTQERYVHKTCEIVSSVLNAISAVNAPHLWRALQTSHTMSKTFGLSHLPSEKIYLEALAEAYKIADSWDTRRQVLSGAHY
ncbi:hypothetical protein QZH41_008817 [Actinostola sp. cb2023]|nr:hypothetical protein QZH41_008817 [Actinostola sp. cb2023]